MSIEELYWLAGWLEGEGSFIKAPPSCKGCRIQGACTDEDVIAKVANLFGNKYQKQKPRKDHKDHWKTVFM